MPYSAIAQMIVRRTARRSSFGQSGETQSLVASRSRGERGRERRRTLAELGKDVAEDVRAVRVQKPDRAKVPSRRPIAHHQILGERVVELVPLRLLVVRHVPAEPVDKDAFAIDVHRMDEACMVVRVAGSDQRGHEPSHRTGRRPPLLDAHQFRAWRSSSIGTSWRIPPSGGRTPAPQPLNLNRNR